MAETVRCLSCGYVVESPHVCEAKSVDSLGVELERACISVQSPLTGRSYPVCFVARSWHGMTSEVVEMRGESMG